MTGRIIPRPLRDMFLGPYFIGQITNQKKTYFDSRDPDNPAEQMVYALCRIVLTASALFALNKTKSSIPVATVLGFCLSLPSVAIAGGSWLAYYGVTSTVTALATGSFKHLAIGLAGMASGYTVLEFHDWLPNAYHSKNNKDGFQAIGILEGFLILPLAERYKEALINRWKKK